MGRSDDGVEAARLEKDVVAQCLKSGCKFTDASFPCDGSSLYRRDPRLMTLEWKRLSELSREPSLFVDGVEEGDIVQGELGDCWFLGSMSVVATRNDLLYPLFVSAHPSIGFYQIRFFIDAQWRVVTIDDYVPMKFGQIRFAKCVDKNEMWVPLMEKAFAKLMGCYEHITSGDFSEGMTNLTGEGCEIYPLNPSLARDSNPATSLWEKLKYFASEQFLMGCAISHGGRERDRNGLLTQHAYAILRCCEPKLAPGVRLVQLRNPWGMKEWSGSWSDGSREWNAAVRAELNHEDKDDGTFFMTFEDFLNNYTEMAVCRLLTDSVGKVWSKYVMRGEWGPQTAGGCPNTQRWKLNPQYWLTVHQPVTVFFHLAQGDHRCEGISATAYESMGLYLYRVEDNRARKTELGGGTLHQPEFINSREYSFSRTMEPGAYILMPCLWDAGVQKRFFLSIYTEDPVVECGVVGQGPHPKSHVAATDLSTLSWLNRAGTKKGAGSGLSPRKTSAKPITTPVFKETVPGPTNLQHATPGEIKAQQPTRSSQLRASSNEPGELNSAGLHSAQIAREGEAARQRLEADHKAKLLQEAAALNDLFAEIGGSSAPKWTPSGGSSATASHQFSTEPSQARVSAPSRAPAPVPAPSPPAMSSQQFGDFSEIDSLISSLEVPPSRNSKRDSTK